MKKILKLKYLYTFKTILLLLFVFFSFNFAFNDSHTKFITFTKYVSALDAWVDTDGTLHNGVGLDPKLPSIGEMAEKSTKYLIHILFVIPFSWLTTFGANMAGILIDPAILNAIFLENSSSTALYNIWTFVRDIFNVFLIFILLFSAFATIFQIQKYHLLKSNVLVMIMIMALLVNFSWPITRVIMDAGNVTMFYLIDTLLEATENAPKGEQFFGSLIEETQLIKMLTLSGPENETAYDNSNISDQIGAAVFLLFFAITFITIAIIFLIRTSLFVILLIFSPIGFAAIVFPGTKKFATMWWSNMLKWAFIGPAMIFMVFISTIYILIMRTLSTEINAHGFSDSTLVTNGIVYLSGLVMLWSGMLVANKMGGNIAKLVTSRATKTRNFALKNYHRLPLKAGKFTAGMVDHATGNRISKGYAGVSGTISGGLKNIKRNFYDKQKKNYQKERDFAEKRVQGGHHAASAKKELQTKYEEDFKDKTVTTENLIQKASLKNKNEAERRAARTILLKGNIKHGKQLTSAIFAIRDDTESVKTLLKNANSSLFKDDDSDVLYKNIHNAINSGISSNATTKKQTSELNKRFADVGRADVTYDFYKNISDPDAAKNAIGHLNTVKNIAKQEKLLENLANNSTGTYNDIKVYIDPVIDSPILRTEFIKNASKKTRNILKAEILNASNIDKKHDLDIAELQTINRELTTLNYSSTLSTADIDRKTALEARKSHIKRTLAPRRT